MEARAVRVPWWYVAITALVLTAVVGATRAFGFAAQVVAGLFVLTCLVAAIQRRSR